MRPIVRPTLLALLLAAAPAVAQDTLHVLPDDHPSRPQPPPRTDRSLLENAFGLLGWIGTRPFEFLGTGVEGTAVWYEDERGGFASGLTGSAARVEEPSKFSFRGGPIGTRSGFIGLGLRFHHGAGETGPRAGAAAAFTNRLYREANVSVGWNDPGKRVYGLVSGFYELDTMDRYWGTGAFTEDLDKASFSWERWGLRATAGLPEERRGIRANVFGGWETSSIFEGRSASEPDAVDLFPEARFSDLEVLRGGGAAGLDWRDAPGHPTSGVLVLGSAEYFSRRDTEEAEDWLTWAGEGQAHLPLGSEWYIVSLRGLVQEARPDGDVAIPFIYRPTLGGSTNLRGYDSWRFRDNAIATASAEFRWKIWIENTPDPETAGTLEGFLFYDVGALGEEVSELETDELLNSYGLGVRMYLLDKHVFGFGLGYGDEGGRILFTTGDPW